MVAPQRADSVVVHAPAKLNLFFEVLRRRDDGFHEIETLMVPVSLYDTLFFEETLPSAEDCPGGIQFSWNWAARGGGASVSSQSGSQGEKIPEGTANIVVRGLELLRERAGTDRGARVCLVKRIPSGAGLGGGSSDAAAALLAANRVWRLGWSTARLAALGAEVGSDVPLFVHRHAAVCRGRGERIESANVGDLHAVVVCPRQRLSTAAVYAACRPARQPRIAAPLLERLATGRGDALGPLMHNRLQPTAEQLAPVVGRLRDAFAGLDCLAHQMTGSGSAYFGICRHARHARRLAALLRAKNLGQVYTVRRAH